MKFDAKQFNRIVMGAVIVGFAAVVVAAIVTAWTVAQNQEHARLVTHTYKVEQELTALRLDVERMEVARRGFLLQYDEQFQTIYTQTADEIPPIIDRIEAMTADNPKQRARVTAIRALASQYRLLADRSMSIARLNRPAAMRDFKEGATVPVVRQLRAEATAMLDEENRLLDRRSVQQEQSIRRLYGVLAIAGILLAFVAVGSVAIILRYTRDLTSSRAELAKLNAGLEGMVQERTADLQRANDEIQRFAYIVSHDLRSPLVNVMGFTSELDASLGDLGRCVDEIEQQANGPAVETAKHVIREDLPEAIGFIRTSTQKMDRLINAILRLSREGRRILTPEPLDMNTVLEGVADSLKQRADQAGAEIVIEGVLPDIVSDRTAIEQVFSNLAENAVKYSKPGRAPRVIMRGRTLPGRVLYEVEDNGRGIDPKDHERIFELFRRSGVQDVAGEGIGLAHVRALVYRLGGLINCESELDKGAVFRVSLPATLTPETTTD